MKSRHVEEHVDWRKRDGGRDLNALGGDAALVDQGEREDELHIQIGDHLEAVRHDVVRVVVEVAEVAHDHAQLAYLAATGGSMKNIKFEDKKYVYLPYEKVTPDNVNEFVKDEQ